jgi:hypothetical protein
MRNLRRAMTVPLAVSAMLIKLHQPLASQELAATVAPGKQYCQGLEAAIRLRREVEDSIKRLINDSIAGIEDTAERKAASKQRKHLRQVRIESTAFRDELENRLRHYLDIHPPRDTVANSLDSVMNRLEQDSMVVSVFGNGNIKTAIADTSGQTRVQGAVGVVRSTCRADFTVQLNVAAAGDTLFRDYGTSLLAPATGGFFKAGLVDFRAVDAMRLGALGRIGIHVYGTVSTNNWAVAQGDTSVFQATIAGLGAGVYKQLLRNDLDGTFVNVGLDLGIAYRGLYGDLATSTNQGNRIGALDSKAKHFVGPEIGFSLQVSQVRGALHFYYFPSTDIPGLGRGQVVAGFAVQGGIISRRILRDRN